MLRNRHDRPSNWSIRVGVVDNFGEHLIEGGLGRMFVDAEPGGCVSLGIAVDEKRAESALGQAGGKIHGRCRLANSSLLIHDTPNWHD